jgi:hypothetical protein
MFTPAYKKLNLKDKFFSNKDKSLIIDQLKQQRFLQIEEQLRLYSKETIDLFLSEVGGEILKWSIVYAPNADALAFLVSQKQKIDLSKVLNDYALKLFLLYISAEERLKHYDSIRETVMEKFKLLLDLDFHHVSKYMNEESNRQYITEDTYRDFNALLVQKQSSYNQQTLRV